MNGKLKLILKKMNSDNLIFSSKIDPQVEDICFDILLDYFSDTDF